MDLAHELRPLNEIKAKEMSSGGIGLNSNTLLVIKLPDSRILQILSRSLFLAIILLTLPSISSILRNSLSPPYVFIGMDSDLSSFKMLPVLFRDLTDEGLLRKGQKGLIVGSNSNIVDFVKDLEFLKENQNNVVVKTNIGNKLLNVPEEIFDFVFSSSVKSSDFADSVLKNGGIVITQLSSDPSRILQRQPNYRIVYLRRFKNTFIAMRKISSKDGLVSPARRSAPCGVAQEARKVALKGLEDALLEPPKRMLMKSYSRNELRKMKFLPDLMGDSLEHYKRRILISDEKNGIVEEWFHNNYPTRNQYFETYNLEINVERGGGSEKKVSSSSSAGNMAPQAEGIADWLRNNVRQEDFVVMKAEAQVVEDMMKEKTICLIDELFLECKNEWQDGEGKDSKRAYWQCLSLYGSLRDQGVAVHQWWN